MCPCSCTSPAWFYTPDNYVSALIQFSEIQFKTQIWLSAGMASLFGKSCLLVEKLQKHMPLFNKPLEAGLFEKFVYTLLLKFCFQMYPCTSSDSYSKGLQRQFIIKWADANVKLWTGMCIRCKQYWILLKFFYL